MDLPHRSTWTEILRTLGCKALDWWSWPLRTRPLQKIGWLAPNYCLRTSILLKDERLHSPSGGKVAPEKIRAFQSCFPWPFIWSNLCWIEKHCPQIWPSSRHLAWTWLFDSTRQGHRALKSWLNSKFAAVCKLSNFHPKKVVPTYRSYLLLNPCRNISIRYLSVSQQRNTLRMKSLHGVWWHQNACEPRLI